MIIFRIKSDKLYAAKDTAKQVTKIWTFFDSELFFGNKKMKTTLNSILAMEQRADTVNVQ